MTSPYKPALQKVLNAAFDVSYLALLEADAVSLDDELQCKLRAVIVPEVFGVLKGDCERMGKAGMAMEEYFCAHGYKEVCRRLQQELQEEDVQKLLPPDLATRLVFLPAFEVVEG